VPVIRLAGAAGWVQWGTVSTDGTTIRAMRRVPRPGVRGLCRRKASACARPLNAVTQAYHQDAAEDAAVGSRRGGTARRVGAARGSFGAE
jgi:hypothetical protein